MTRPRGQERESGSPATLRKQLCAWPQSRAPACCVDVASSSHHPQLTELQRGHLVPSEGILGLEEGQAHSSDRLEHVRVLDMKRKQETEEIKMCNVSYSQNLLLKTPRASMRHSPPHGRPVLGAFSKPHCVREEGTLSVCLCTLFITKVRGFWQS